jgi:hypothetical protein
MMKEASNERALSLSLLPFEADFSRTEALGN